MQEIVDDLMSLGYSEYEAKVYVGLIKNPEVSGYEASKHSGVPRSKVYEVLNSLVEKGAALEMSVDDRVLYRPLPYRVLVERHRREMHQRLSDLERKLGSVPEAEDEYNFFVLTGRDPLLARVRDMLSSAEHTAFVSCWPEERVALSDDVAAARERGVTVIVLVYENHPEGVGCADGYDTFYHSVTPMQDRQVEVLGRWLMVVADATEVVIGQIKEDAETALCSRNRLVAFLITQAVAHDITVLQAVRSLGEDLQDRLDDETREILQRVQLAATRTERGG